MAAHSLAGRGVVVLGASAGIGHAFATQAIADGARVVVAARRPEKLESLAVEAGGGARVALDVTREDDCVRLGEVAMDCLGEVELFFCSVGYAPLQRFGDVTPADWQRALATNVIGVHQSIRHLLPALGPTAVVAACSSEAVGQARTALGAYTSSKAALNEAMGAWRTEYPERRFCLVRVGSTVPTDFSREFDTELLGWAMKEWAIRGLAQAAFMDVDEVAGMLVSTFAAALSFPSVGIEDLTLRSPSEVTGSAELMTDTAAAQEQRLAGQ